MTGRENDSIQQGIESSDPSNEFDPMANDFMDAKENLGVPYIEEDSASITLPYELKLKRPFTVGTTEYTKIIFKRELNVEALKHLPLDTKEQKMGHFVKPVASMAELPSSVIDKMSMTDFVAAMEVVKHFL